MDRLEQLETAVVALLEKNERLTAEIARLNAEAEAAAAEKSSLEAENRPKPPFSPLPTRRKTALRQEISVFAARKKFLSAKKSRFCRTKTPAKAEKCSIRTVPAPVF